MAAISANLDAANAGSSEVINRGGNESRQIGGHTTPLEGMHASEVHPAIVTESPPLTYGEQSAGIALQREDTHSYTSFTIKNILNELKDVVEWELLGIQLDISASKLEEISKNFHGQVADCKREMIKHWHKSDKTCSWKNIIDALEKISQNVLAEETRKKYCPSGWEHVDDSELDEGHFQEIRDAVGPNLVAVWREFSSAIGFSPSTINGVAKAHPGNPGQCMFDILDKWVRKDYNHEKFGPPSWKTLVKAVASNVGGQNPTLAEKIAQVHHHDNIPSPPTGLKADHVSNTYVVISWQPPDTTKSFITEYQVNYTMHGGSEQLLEVSDTKTHLTSLEPDTNYTVKVRAKNTEFGDYSSAITIHTEIEFSKKVKAFMNSYPSVTFTQLKNTKLIFYGAPRAGKTTLRKQLLKHIEGKELQPCGTIEPSTGFAELNAPIFVQRQLMSKKKNGNKDEWEWTVQGLNDIARSLLLCLNNEQLKKTGSQGMKADESTKINVKATDSPQKEQTADGKGKLESQGLDGDEVPSPVFTSNPTHLTENFKTASPKSVDNGEDVDIHEMFQKAVQTGQWEGVRAALKIDEATFLQIIDGGGQPSFQEIFPLLISGSPLTLLIFKLTDRLDELSQVKHQPKGESESKWDYHYIVQDIIFDALSSFDSLKIPSENETTTSLQNEIANPSQSNNATAWQSKVLLVGTHKDRLEVSQDSHQDKEKNKEAMILAIATQLHGSLSQSKVYKFIQVQDVNMLITGIDNSRKEDIDLVKKKIEEMISVLQPRRIPVPWLVFDFVLHKHGEQNGCCKLEKSKCISIAKRCGVNDDAVDTVLQYLHNEAGTLLYYSDIPLLMDYVIIDFQLIFDSISKIIIQFYEDNSVHGPHVACKESLRKEGYLNASDLKNVPSCLEVNELITLLQHRHIISKIGNTTYFMPCVLPKMKLSYTLSNSSSFLVLFDHGCCPVGLFCATTTELIVKHKWEILKQPQFKNRINLYSPCEKSQRKYNIIFSAFSAHFEVCLMTKAVLEVKYKIHQDVKKALLKVCADMKYSPPSYGFYCPQHCKCGDHSYLPYQHPANCEFSDKSEQMRCYFSDILSDLTEENKQWFLTPPQEKMDSHEQRKVSSSKPELRVQVLKLEDVPTLKLLTSLPILVDGRTKNLKIIQRTSTYYAKLAMYLLDDENLDMVDGLEEKCHHDPEEIITAVYKKWISGTGKKPVTWHTLVGVLKDIELNSLAEEIETVLSI